MSPGGPRRSPRSDPRDAYASYVESLAADAATRIADAAPVPARHCRTTTQVRDAVRQAVDSVGPDIIALSHDIHAHPELAFNEHYAARAVRNLLARHATDAEVGAFGLPTAFRAVAGAGLPRVAVLAEYDALPEIGHGCGHNIICASAVGAFLALAAALSRLDGTAELIGTPAEEGGAGKELIARAGGFDGIAAVVMLHPGTYDLGFYPPLGMRTVRVQYDGLAAHASAVPYLGRNALDAVVSSYQAIAQLRQHILPTDRVHGVITNGGAKPNIVPDRAEAVYYVRSQRQDTMRELSNRLDHIFDAAALMTGTSVDVRWDPYPQELPVRTNSTLLSRYAANLARRGRRVLSRETLTLSSGGSTDFGNVSVRVPGIHPVIKIAEPGVALHSIEFARAAVSADGDRACLDGAHALALTLADFLSDDEFRRDTHAEFAAAE